jgi:hypothetical protein
MKDKVFDDYTIDYSVVDAGYICINHNNLHFKDGIFRIQWWEVELLMPASSERKKYICPDKIEIQGKEDKVKFEFRFINHRYVEYLSISPGNRGWKLRLLIG